MNTDLCGAIDNKTTNDHQMSADTPLSQEESAKDIPVNKEGLDGTSPANHIVPRPVIVTGNVTNVDAPSVSEVKEDQKGQQTVHLTSMKENGVACDTRSPSQSSPPSSSSTSHKETSEEIAGGINREDPKSSNQDPARLKVPPRLIGDSTDFKTEVFENTVAKEGEKVSTNITDTRTQDLAQRGDKKVEQKEDKPKTEKKKAKVKKGNLRKGKWTAEEEQYTMRIIQHFRTGMLSLPGGHTLRSHLAEKLNCDPMRITKKFSGASCLGKRVYNLCDRLQVSSHDLAMAHAELESLERRFKMRIENGTTLPMPSHVTDTLRNTRSEVDHANFMRASYLFVNHPSQSQNLVNGLHGANRTASDVYGNSNTNLQIAFLQNIAANQQHQKHQSVPSQTGFQPNSSIQNQYQMQHKFQMSQQNSLARNAGPAFYNAQLQHGMNPNLLSALLQANASGQNAQSQMYPQAINSFPQNEKSASANSAFSDGNKHISAPGVSSKNAMEALAARYNSASLQQQHLQQMHELQGRQSTHQLKEKGKDSTEKDINRSRGNSHEILSSESQQQAVLMQKVRTKEEQADGRMLLGFLQELQSNHRKAATMPTSSQFVHDSVSTVPQLQSTNASSDGTVTTRESSAVRMKENVLKRGYDISVKKNSDTTATGSIRSISVPNHEGLSSSGDSSDDNKGGSSGDDTDKALSTGPLRKRFRHGGGQRTIHEQDQIDSHHD